MSRGSRVGIPRGGCGSKRAVGHASLGPLSAPVFYARPEGEAIPLPVPPRLASWNRADDPDQVKLATSLGAAAGLLRPSLAGTPEPLALRLDVGLASSIPLLEAHDLDNYAYPLASHLHHAGSRFVSVWCTKQRAGKSTVRVATAVRARPGEADSPIVVCTTASATLRAFKVQIRDQLPEAAVLADGPVSLQLAYAVGPRRNWLNLWKPTIDALDRLLGRSSPDRDWHPRDGRITELGLSCTVDNALGDGVVIAVTARPLPIAARSR